MLSRPDVFWRSSVPSPLVAGWVEDSSPCSDELPLSKREVLALVLMAYAAGGVPPTWSAGFDPEAGEPNDGFVSDGTVRLHVESKLVPQFSTDVLRDILATYEKYERLGGAYGSGRVLFILTNAGDGRMVKISSLRDQIADASPFDAVVHGGAVSTKEDGAVVVFHLFQAFPALTLEGREPGAGLTQIDFDLRTGLASVPHAGIPVASLVARNE